MNLKSFYQLLKQFVSTSRPRFWIYLIWPYIVWLMAWWWFDNLTQIISLFSFQVIWFLLYFSYPANLLVYGVNDIFDYETDKLNEKKAGYEWLITPDKQKQLLLVLAFLNIPFLLLSILPNPESYLRLILFVLSSILYSAPPLRAKAKPILDTIVSSFVYIGPGYVGYFISWWTGFDRMILGALLGWNMAMHAYSAIPDIEADTQAWINTVATFYGKSGTLWFCIICYSLSIILSLQSLGWFSGIVWLVYIIMMALSFRQNLFRLYTYFPWINMIVWFLLFWYVVWLKCWWF